MARDLSAEPHTVTCLLEEPVSIAGEERRQLGYKHYGYDPTLTPPGKSDVVVMFPSNYAYWEALAADRRRYEEEKKNIAGQVIGLLERRFPGYRPG